MRSVRQLLDELQQRRFVGREKELAVMRQELCFVEDDWRLLHFHGPGGIGKTALLRAFQRINKDRLIFYVDGRSYSHPAHFMKDVRILLAEKGYSFQETEDDVRQGLAEAETLNRIANEGEGIVLLLDSLDRWGAVETWLRERWLTLLTLRVKVCSAGRYPLDERSPAMPEWSGIVRNVRLSPLNKKEIDSYTAVCGIADRKLQDAIERFSGGIPLALSLACEMAIQHGAPSILDGVQTINMITSMDRSLFAAENESLHHKRLLAAASLLWRFDQDMLERMLAEEIPQGIFSDFCNSPYVMIFRHGGYYILDAVRKWMKAELEHRAPETYSLYRRRALEAIERRWMATASGDAARKKLLRLEKMYLLSNSFMQSYYFSGDGQGFEIKQARKEDLALLGSMYERSIMTFPPYLPDDTHQHTFIDAVWEAEPTAFRVVWHGDKLVGFYAFVPLNDKTRTVFAENDITRTYLRKTPSQDQQYLNWIGATAPEFDPDVVSFIVRDIFCHSLSGKLVFTTIPFAGPVDSMCQLGFERLPWADYRSPGGQHFQAAVIDLREDDFFNRIPSTEDGIAKPAVAPEARIRLLKQLLEHYHTLDLETELIGTFRIMLPEHHSGELSDEAVARRIKSIAEKSFQRLAGGKNHAQLQERILRLFYIERIGSHETVAARLGLPMTTYYRYLKKAIGHMADDLFV